MSRYSIPLFDLNAGKEEAEAVKAAVESGWISMGPRVADFEAGFAAELGAKHAVAVTNGTAALHVAFALLIDAGDEVILPSLTFVATANAVRFAGGTPVFADIVGDDDFSIDPVDVRAKITPRTKAIVPVHYAGFACDMDALDAIAAEHGLHIIEDAAHAPGSRFGQRRCGTFGDIGCFSFFSNKNITCAEGGMLVTDDDDLAARARLMRSHGMTAVSYDRARGHATEYDVVEVGYNYRLDDIRAALGLEQLKKLAADVKRRAALRARYEDNLRDIDGMTLPYSDAQHRSSNYILPTLLQDGGSTRRDEVRRKMADRGIQTSIHYPAIHRFSIYQDQSQYLPRTEFVADHEISVPLFTTMSERQVDEVTDALRQALRGRSAA